MIWNRVDIYKYMTEIEKTINIFVENAQKISNVFGQKV